jgi:hypothetical protein
MVRLRAREENPVSDVKQPIEAAPENVLGVASMAVGIASIPLSLVRPVGLALGIAALVLGYLGRVKVTRGLATNGGQVALGLVTGFVGLILGVLFLILSLLD